MDFLKDPIRNQYDTTKGVLTISKIFDWFSEDFEHSFGGIKKMFKKLGPSEAKKALAKKGTIKYFEYNWDLNDAKTQNNRAITKK